LVIRSHCPGCLLVDGFRYPARFATLVLTVCVALFPLVSTAADQAAPAEAVVPSEGQPVPKFGAPDLDRNVFTVARMLSELAADNGCAALVFFTTVCEPCRREILQLKSESARLSSAGVRVVLVAAGEDRPKVRSFQDRIQVPFRTVTDVNMLISRLFGLTTPQMTVTVPRTFVFGADGVVKAVIAEPGTDVVNDIISACRGSSSARPPASLPPSSLPAVPAPPPSSPPVPVNPTVPATHSGN